MLSFRKYTKSDLQGKIPIRKAGNKSLNRIFILDRNEEVVALLSGNADDSACHFFNSNLTLEVNKGASLTFEVDTTEADIVQHVREENMVVVNDGENHRLLIIKEVSDVHGTDYIKEVYCEDASAEIAGVPGSEEVERTFAADGTETLPWRDAVRPF